ncbi:MAG: GHKL domain-containing protein [Cytophagia bacterium]|nr:GHKL domain-containing protein [Cytophagia bacterium]
MGGGSSVSLDSLCKKFKIDYSLREKHTALLDCKLLAKVYVELIDKRELLLDLNQVSKNNGINNRNITSPGIIIPISIEQKEEYIKFLKKNVTNAFALEKEKIEIGHLLTTQQDIFKEVAQRKGIHLIIEDHTENLSFNADKEALNRILENLLSNAIKFSDAYSYVKLKVSTTPTHVKFEVKDQGPGISKNDLPKLFGKFQRLSARPTGGESSSGLGLSIVKELVDLMKGKISVETAENEGTSFIVEIAK